jgi:hypothetical protein
VQDPGVYPFQGLSADGKTQKWGFIDADGKVVIQPTWDAVGWWSTMGQSGAFNEGLCGISQNGKWGYIDAGGNLVIPIQFDAAGPFMEGMTTVKLGNQVGFIDKTGHYAINPQFDEAYWFHNGLAVVRSSGSWGFINKSGEFVIKPQFQGLDPNGFWDGLAMACDGKCGFINKSGIFAIKPQFDSEGPFSQGLAAIQINNKWGYINISGKIVINPQFDLASAFSGGFAVVSVSGHVGSIDQQGKFVINPGQYNILPGESSLEVVRSDDGFGLLTRDGKWIVGPSKALTGISAVIGKVFYGTINGLLVPISMQGKILTGPYRGAMLNSLAQDIQNESDAIQVMHAVVNAEAGYSAAYPAKGFASTLDQLEASPGSTPDENHAGLIDFDIPSGVKSNYQFSITIPEGTSTGGTNFNYQLTAKPQSGHVGRTFCVDSSGTVRYAMPGETCSTTSPAL